MVASQVLKISLLLAVAFYSSPSTASQYNCYDLVFPQYSTNETGRVELIEGQSLNVTLLLSSSSTAFLPVTISGCSQFSIRVLLEADKPPRSHVETGVIKLGTSMAPHELQVDGLFVGYSKILLQTLNETLGTSDDEASWQTFKEIKVATIRRRRPRDEIFQGIIFLLIIFGNAGIGLNVNWQEIRDCLKRPIGPVIGFCCQYIIMPLTAFLVVRLIDMEPSIALGIFIVGCSPGGGGSNYHTYFLGGNLPLSVTMTILSTIAALGMMPLWIYTMGKLVAEGAAGGNVSISFQGIGASLASTVFPFAVGIFVRWRWPVLADKLFRFVVRPMLAFIFLYLVTAGILTNIYVFKLLDIKILLAAVVLPYAGFSLGFVIAYLLRQGFSKSITIAIETGIQSASVAMATLMMSLPHPDSDISVVGPIATTMLTPIPLWIAEICLAIYLCVKKKRCFIFDSCRGIKDDDEAGEKTKDSAAAIPLVSSSAGSSPDSKANEANKV